MGKALYRKYRSKSLDEIVGQEHITQTLSEALKQGRISHAYLFTGPRGVGKTSIARIWAHEINQLPYESDAAHLDIIEIDAASNRRIDEIRDLRDRVHIAPAAAKYKVYIIDEVHMLTREAFNALLKTLEEPPEHAVFILATTDAHKLPETIISRTQRYNFRPVETSKVVAHLRHIAETENIAINDEALELLARHGEGSFRDSISMLDQASSYGTEINGDTVRELLGIPPEAAINQLVDALQHSSSSATLMSELNALYTQGYQAATIARLLGEQIRSRLVAGSIAPDLALAMLESLLAVPSAHIPERYLEICLLRHASATTGPATAAPPSKTPVAAAKKTTPVVASPPVTPAAKPAPVAQPTPPVTKQPEADEPTTKEPLVAGSDVFDESLWPSILHELKRKHNTLYGIIRMAQPSFTPDTLTLAFSFAFHQKRVNEAASQKKLTDIVYILTGETVAIKCIVDKATKATGEAKIAAPKDISAISNIFGGGEVLES
jgi:DNA polymerase III subunit gamma/tau